MINGYCDKLKDKSAAWVGNRESEDATSDKGPENQATALFFVARTVTPTSFHARIVGEARLGHYLPGLRQRRGGGGQRPFDRLRDPRGFIECDQRQHFDHTGGAGALRGQGDEPDGKTARQDGSVGFGKLK